MKKLLSLLLTLTMALSLFACTKPDEDKAPNEENPTASQDPTNPSTPGDEGDGLVTVYQMISQTAYNADGSKGGRQDIYTYDDMGNLLAVERDSGAMNKVWNEEMMTNDYIQDPFDGIIDSSHYCTYNERGHITCSLYQKSGPVTENGKLIEGLNHGWDYTYLDDGRIDTVKVYSWGIDGGKPDYDAITSYKCSYNENKQLISVVCTTPDEEGSEFYRRLYDFKYDEQGRLIEDRHYGGYLGYYTACNRYTYNSAGLLATAEHGRVNVDSFGILRGEEESFSVSSYDSHTFFYDEQGRVIDPEKNSIRYDEQGRLIALDQYNATFTYLPDGGKEIARVTMLSGTRFYLFDEHENLTRITYSDGEYIQFEYRPIQVTKEQAQRLARIQRLQDGTNGFYWTWDSYEFLYAINIPNHPLDEYKQLLHLEEGG